MPETVSLTINGRKISVAAGTPVAVAALLAGPTAALRRSAHGGARGPLCGMGICYECRVTIDGVSQTKSCQTPCRDGMVVVTDEF